MNSPLALVLAAAGGLCLLVGGWYLTLASREMGASRRSALRVFGAACLVIAGQEYAALGVYRAVNIDAYVGAVRLHTVFVLAAPVVIAWFVALYTGMKARWLLWIYAGAAATVILVNLASPTTMHFSDVLDVVGVALPWGRAARPGDRDSFSVAAICGLSDRAVLRPVPLRSLVSFRPQHSGLEQAARGRTRRSRRHDRHRAARSAAGVGPARGRVRVSGIRDRVGNRAATQPGFGNGPCRRGDR